MYKLTTLKMMKHKNKGFTLIELLVVIAIVGILSAVVLTQLNSARRKGADAKVKATFRNLGSMSAIFYENNGNFTGICSYDTAPIRFNSALSSINAVGTCQTSVTSFRVRSQLTFEDLIAPAGGDWACVDASGNIKYYGADPGASAAVCP